MELETEMVKKVVAHNYTGYGWEGKKYQETKSLSTTDCAKLIRKEIKEKFPGIKVSVRTQYFAGGSSIDVRIVDCGYNPINPEHNPLENDMDLRKSIYIEKALQLKKDLEKIGNQYRYDDSDGMIDYFNTRFYFSVEFDWESKIEWEKERGIHYSQLQGGEKNEV